MLIQYHLPFCLLFLLSHSLGFPLYLVKLEHNGVIENITGLGPKIERFCAFRETFCAILETFCVFHVVKFFESLWIFRAFHGTFCILRKTFRVFQKTFCEFRERFCVFQITKCAFQENIFYIIKKRFFAVVF